MSNREPLVSVIIPCYNMARFLGEAIESVLSQTYLTFEILVIDDGSTDHAEEVADSYASVRYFRQENQGPSAARNFGASRCNGQFLVFLDADDRLLPDALKWGVKSLSDSSGCAFVSGRYRLIDGAGSGIPTWTEIRQGDESGIVSFGWELIESDGSVSRRWVVEQPVERDHYSALLQRNYIEMPSTVMYRQTIFVQVGGFDCSLRAAEDYDLFLRIACRYPVTCHNYVIAEYRQHDTNTTRDKGAMLVGALQVLDRQRASVRGSKKFRKAFSTGVEAFIDHYGFWSIFGPFFKFKPNAWDSATAISLFVFYYWMMKIQKLFGKLLRV